MSQPRRSERQQLRHQLSCVREQIFTTPELLAASKVFVCGFHATALMNWLLSVPMASMAALPAHTGGVAKF